MRRLAAFEFVSLDGFFVDAQGDMGWAHKHDPEWNEFSAANAGGESTLLFGRVTYEMMASFWPTPAAAQAAPLVAEAMNRMPKVVFSRTLASASWQNTVLVKGDLAAEVRKLKSQAGPAITLLGSGSLVSQLTEASLIDEYQIVVCPIVLGRGRTLFETVPRRRVLKLIKTRAFGNGNVVLWYEPAS